MKEVENTLRYQRLKIPSDNLTEDTLVPSNPALAGSKALKEFNTSTPFASEGQMFHDT